MKKQHTHNILNWRRGSDSFWVSQVLDFDDDSIQITFSQNVSLHANYTYENPLNREKNTSKGNDLKNMKKCNQ